MKFRSLLTALALTAPATDSEAGPLRRHAQPVYQPVNQPAYQPTYQSVPQPPTTLPSVITPAAGYTTDSSPVVTTTGGVIVGESVSSYTPASTPVYQTTSFVQTGGLGNDALDEVNAKRAARGLRPFVRDEGLTQAARAAAEFRAANGLFGHTGNDFAFVPAGTSASSAGCAAYPASYGWMSCCVYDNYTYAGAAWVTGRDGRRFMHLFVR